MKINILSLHPAITFSAIYGSKQIALLENVLTFQIVEMGSMTCPLFYPLMERVEK